MGKLLDLLIKGHFLLSSGLHSPVYFEKFKIFSQPSWVEEFCWIMSDYFSKHDKPQAVADLALGEKAPRRNQHVTHSERVLVVDDVLTIGESIKALCL